jgi:hypothetical protein
LDVDLLLLLLLLLHLTPGGKEEEEDELGREGKARKVCTSSSLSWDLVDQSIVKKTSVTFLETGKSG